MSGRQDASDPADLTLAAAARLLRERRLSPVELVRAVLARIDAVEERVRAFVQVDRREALETAHAAERSIATGEYRGPLHGIVIGVKDIFDVAGSPTGAGSRAFGERPATRDAAAVERLRAAGAVIIGKTVTHELAYGVVSRPTRNPWNTDYIPGGSSGGSGAALAAGECLGAIGTDTGGSIRVPAALNGVVGLKPTYGRVSKRGVLPLSWSLDHVGPMGRSVEDVALLLQVLAGYDPADPTTVDLPVPNYSAALVEGVRGLRLGVVSNYFFDRCDPEVEAAVRVAIEVLADQGAAIREVSVPDVELSPAAALAIIVPEAASCHRPILLDRPGDLSDSVRVRLQAGEVYPATYYLKAQRVRNILKERFRTALAAVDVLLVPTVPHAAARQGQSSFPIPGGGEESLLSAYGRNSYPCNLVGLPALSVPCGFTTGGLPVGLQVVGRPFDEATVLRVGRAYEAATDWHRCRPPL